MAISVPRSPLPAIQISLAPYEAPVEVLKSPFDCLSPISPGEDEGPRSALLTPPPMLSPGRGSPLSPLRPADAPVKGTGLERERFEAMLKASRERNTLISGGTRKTHDLRKEIALKAHKSKQSERRALFLSKLQAPPSPSATMTAKTPPESPAILHYSLPSPGLTSPLALYESITEADQQAFKSHGWVEQVDFRLPEGKRVKPVIKLAAGRGKPLPSLAQITARLSSQGHLPQFVHAAPAEAEKVDVAAPKRRLPAFLQKSEKVPAAKEAPQPVIKVDAPVVIKVDASVVEAKPRILLNVGRLRAPVHAKPTTEVVKKVEALPTHKLEITTTVVPRTSHMSPTDLSESNLNQFNSRTRMAKSMLSTLRRRAHTEDVVGATGADDTLFNAKPSFAEDEAGKNMRRRSSPAELPRLKRTAFAHPVLALPGAF